MKYVYEFKYERSTLRIMILTTTFPKNKDDFGTPRFVYDLSYNFSDRNIPTYVITPDRPDSKLEIEKISNFFSVYRYKYFIKKAQHLTTGDGIIPSLKKSKLNGLLIPFIILKQLFYSIRVIKKEKIDVVNSHWLVPSGLIGAILQKFYGRKNIITVHAAGLYLLEKIPLGKEIGKFIYKNSSRILVVSNYGKKRLYNLLSINDVNEFNKKVKVVPMGVYCSTYSKMIIDNVFEGNDDFNILFIGRLVEKKGLIYALEALKLLNNLKIKFHICGDGLIKNELLEYTRNNKLTEEVIFYGRISEEKKIQFLKSSDVMIVPSIITREGDMEGLPVVILEALACKLPVIASDVGGIKDGVIDNETGIIIMEKNPTHIAEAITKLYNNRDFLKTLSENSEKISHKFSWKEVTRLYLTEIISS